MNIKVELTCKFCNEIYKAPITLTCGDSVCKHHLEELVPTNWSKFFCCPICNEENSNQDFKINKILEQLIKKELHQFKINPIYEEVLKNLKTEIVNLEAIFKEPENYIYE